MRGHLRHFIAIVYFVAMFFTASHIHHDISDHHTDCKICTISHNFSVADLPQILTQITILPLLHQPRCFALRYTYQESPKGYFSRSPPLFSL